MKNEIFNKVSVKEEHKLQKEIAKNYAKKLKELFGDGESKYDENYAEDGTKISNHRNFKILNNISYDNETKQFNFDKISDELKEMFMSYGIKKKDLENDMYFAFTLFKKVIVGLSTEKKLKNSALDNIEHNFPPLAEREKLRKQEEAAEAKMNSKRNVRKKKQAPKQAPKQKPKKGMNKRGSVPLPPPPPPPPPFVPNAVPTAVPHRANNPVNTPEKPQISREDEIRNIILKPKVKVAIVKEENKDKIGGDGKNILQDILTQALKRRKHDLHIHDDDDENEEDKDW